MRVRYSVRWTSADRAWWCPQSFGSVAAAKEHAHEHRPDGATRFLIQRIGGDHVVEGNTMDDWQSIGDAPLQERVTVAWEAVDPPKRTE
jgi:hypothetical protein